MNGDYGFERDVERWLDAEAPATGPAGLHGAVIDRARTARQRPGWQVTLRGGGIGPSAGIVRRPAIGIALVVLALTLALVGALLAGAFRPSPVNPLVRNGLIAYSVFENRERAGQTSWTHWLAEDGSSERAPVKGTCPTFSADGTVLAYRSNWSGTELLVAEPDGSAERSLPLTVDFFYRDRSYALSPDGTQVAWFKAIDDITFDFPDGTSEGYGAKNELWITPVASGQGVRILPASAAPTESYGLPAWSPDGRHIAFEGRIGVPSTEGHAYRAAVYVIDAAGNDLRALTTRPASGDSLGLAWSSDSLYLAYLGLPDGVPLPSIDEASPPADVFVIGADGTGERNVTNSPASEREPRWSPDSARLGYLASDTGEEEGYRLVTVPMVGPDPIGSPVEGPVARAFAWSPDSTRLLSIDPTRIQSVDAALREPPTTLVDVSSWPPPDTEHPDAYTTDYESCAPAWQRLGG